MFNSAITSSSHLPGGKIVLLLFGQGVDLNTHGFQFQPCDLLVYGVGNGIDLTFQIGVFFGQILGAEGLVGKLISITLEGCPSAAARLMSRPSPNT